MAPLVLIAASLFATPHVAIDPPQPRLGDPVVVYVAGVDHGGEWGSVEAFGYAFTLQPAGEGALRAFVAIPSDIEPGAHPLKLSHPRAQDAWRPSMLQVERRAFKTSHLRVAKKFTKKKRSDKLKARLKREQAEVQLVWTATPTPVRDLGRPVRPTKTAITGHYGTARVFNNERRSVHYGMDLGGRIGTPVYATAAGKVVMSSMRWGSGGTLILDHGGGLYTTYFHLSKRRVKQGQTVKKGQRIGDVGRSGRVTGPHLHFGVALRAAYADGAKAGKVRSLYVDPAGLLTLEIGRTAPATAKVVQAKPSPRKRAQ